MTDIIDGETGELVAYEPPAPVTLFGSNDPAEVVRQATVVADSLASVIRAQHLYKTIGQKNHVLVEGWTLLGSMTGVFPVVEWTRPVEKGWEARVEARTRAGELVGAAEAMCTRDEKTWSGRDDYAIRSMAQTRATSKALRGPLGFIVQLAGYNATPAEEIPNEAPNPSATGADTKLATEPQLKRLFALCSALDKKDVKPPSEDKWEDYVKAYCRDTWGLESRRQLTRGQVQFLYEHLEGGTPF